MKLSGKQLHPGVIPNKSLQACNCGIDKLVLLSVSACIPTCMVAGTAPTPVTQSGPILHMHTSFFP